MKLTIHVPILQTENGRVNLSYRVSAADDQSRRKDEMLWFSIDEKYRDSISSEVCDGVVLMLLFYALKGGYDIESEIPMSEGLYFSLTQQFIPQMTIMNPSAHTVKLHMETICPEWHPTGVATAMSCGIDSLTTYYEYTSDEIPESYRLTHLTFYEQGAHHGGGGRTWEEQDRLFQAQLERAKKFSREVGKDLIDIRSNLDDFLNKLLWHEYYEHTHTYKNLGITLLLQKTIGKYYYSATYGLDEFDCSMDDDSAHYEKWMIPNCSTNNTSFFSANSALSRIEKIQFLSGKRETYDNVLVCYTDGVNCGHCMKCWRTMLEMDACGVLDLYKNSFDTEAFRKQKDYYLTEMISRAPKEDLMRQIYFYMKEHHVDIPLKCRIRGSIRYLHRRLMK